MLELEFHWMNIAYLLNGRKNILRMEEKMMMLGRLEPQILHRLMVMELKKVKWE